MASRGQSASASFSSVNSRTRQPCRRHSLRNSSPFRYVAMHNMVSDMTAVRVYSMTDDATVRDNPSAHRFELRLAEEVAFLQYRKPATGPIVLVHTEVPV